MSSEVYLLEDLDLGMFKIGRRRPGSNRFGSPQSCLRNGYPTNIQLIIVSRELKTKEAIELERGLHDKIKSYQVNYPKVTISINVNGHLFEKKRAPNGYSEWFKLPPQLVQRVIDILTRV